MPGPPSEHGKRTTTVAKSSTNGWLYLFLAVQFTFQAAQMLESLGGYWRLGCRVGVFTSSLLMLGLLPGQARNHHPSQFAGLAVLGVMALGLLHPDANPLSGIAHWFLSVAIWAPLFWVGRMALSARTLRNVLLMLWLFNAASAGIGVLQVYYPEQFAPSAEFVRNAMGAYADGLLISLEDGRQVWRPCGLSDTPGGSASAGSFAVLVGMFLITSQQGQQLRHGKLFWFRALLIGGIAAGSFCIYICEIRSVMIVTAISAITMVTVLTLQGRITRAGTALLLLPFIIAGGFSWTSSLSGNRVGDRISTLTASSAADVYYKNRGHFIEASILEELPKYPLGAGLGRYGMMFAYFGDPTLSHSRPLWVEVQLTAWLYDGGLLLLLLAYFAVIVACYTSLRISLNKNADPFVTDSAVIITALNIGWLALTFNYPLFLGQDGIMFWLLNASLFSATQHSRIRYSTESKLLTNRDQLSTSENLIA